MAVTNYNNPKLLAEISAGIGEPMVCSLVFPIIHIPPFHTLHHVLVSN